MKKRSSYKIFKSSIFALLLRELYDSVGINKMGYFWLFFDVLFVIVFFAGIRGYLRGIDIPGLDAIVFLAINVMAFYFFRTTVQMVMGSFSANKKLFDYKQIKPIDIAISKFLFNFYIRIVAAFLLVLVGLFFNFDMNVKDFNMVVLAVFWLAIFSFGIGLLSAVLGSFFDFYKKAIGFIMLPLLFTSAIFYTVESLPQVLRELIVYNPVANFMEMIHGNYFSVLDTRYVDYEYMLLWTVIPLFLGFFFYVRSEKGIIAS